MKVNRRMYELTIEAETDAEKKLLNKLWNSLPERTAEHSPSPYKWGEGIKKEDESQFGIGFDGKKLHFRGY